VILGPLNQQDKVIKHSFQIHISERDLAYIPISSSRHSCKISISRHHPKSSPNDPAEDSSHMYPPPTSRSLPFSKAAKIKQQRSWHSTLQAEQPPLPPNRSHFPSRRGALTQCLKRGRDGQLLDDRYIGPCNAKRLLRLQTATRSIDLHPEKPTSE
jgi:hypothetical protein